MDTQPRSLVQNVVTLKDIDVLTGDNENILETLPGDTEDNPIVLQDNQETLVEDHSNSMENTLDDIRADFSDNHSSIGAVDVIAADNSIVTSTDEDEDADWSECDDEEEDLYSNTDSSDESFIQCLLSSTN